MTLPLSSSPRPRITRGLRASVCVAAFCCVALTSGAASATVEWGRVGTVTTLTSGQLCKNDGKYIICDSTTPTILGSNVGIGTTSPGDKLTVIGTGTFGSLGLISLGDATQNYINLTTDGNGTLLLGLNLGLSSGLLVNPKTHSTLAGSGILIPGNAASINNISENDIGFFTSHTGSVTGGTYYGANPAMVIKASGNVGIGTNSPSDTLTVNGTVGYLFGSDLTTTGSQNNVAIGTSSALRYNGTAAATFTGIAAGANGQILYLHNPSAYTLTLSNQSLSSSAANRIVTGTGADLSVPSNTSVTMQYDATAALWRVTGSSNSANTLAAGSTGQVQFNGGTNLAADSNLFWDNTNKRLGLATPSPTEMLDVSANVRIAGAYLKFTVPSGSPGVPGGAFTSKGTIFLYDDGTNRNSFITEGGTGRILFQSTGGAGTGFGFYTGGAASAGTEKFSISNSGNIGIGTTSPYGTGLHLYLNSNAAPGDGSATGLQVQNANSSSSAAAGLLMRNDGLYTGFLQTNSGTNTSFAGVNSVNIGNANGNPLGFVTNNALRMMINASGNVGIGTTSPDALLSLGGGAARTIDMVRNATANTAGNGLTVQAGGATSAATDKVGGDLTLSSGIATGTGSSNIQFQTSTAQGSTNTTDNSPTTKMTITGAGNVGIGTTSTPTGIKTAINGVVQVAGTGSEPCTAAQVGAMRYNAAGNYMEICSFP